MLGWEKVLKIFRYFIDQFSATRCKWYVSPYSGASKNRLSGEKANKCTYSAASKNRKASYQTFSSPTDRPLAQSHQIKGKFYITRQPQVASRKMQSCQIWDWFALRASWTFVPQHLLSAFCEQGICVEIIIQSNRRSSSLDIWCCREIILSRQDKNISSSTRQFSLNCWFETSSFEVIHLKSKARAFLFFSFRAETCLPSLPLLMKPLLFLTLPSTIVPLLSIFYPTHCPQFNQLFLTFCHSQNT